MLLLMLIALATLGWMSTSASATNRMGKNGERHRVGKPSNNGRRGDDRFRQGEQVQRVVLDIRTNEAAGRSRRRSRRRKQRSRSSESSSSSKCRAKEDKQEIARLKELLAAKEAEEAKREAARKQDEAEATRRREMEDFKAQVMALLPKQPQQPSLTVSQDKPSVSPGVLTPEVVQRAGFMVHEVADFAGCKSWDDVEVRLRGVSNTKLKEMLQRKGTEEVPSSKPAVIKLVMRILKGELSSAQ